MIEYSITYIDNGSNKITITTFSQKFFEELLINLKEFEFKIINIKAKEK
jgi:hypothetical protein